MNAPKTFTAVWTILQAIVDDNTKAKIFINSGANDPNMLKLIAPEQLEERYGGLNPTKTEDFWPPSVPNTNFGPWTED